MKFGLVIGSCTRGHLLQQIWYCGIYEDVERVPYPCLRVPMYTKGSDLWIFRELNDWRPSGARQRQRQQNNQWNSTSTRMLQCLHQSEPEIRMAEGMQGTPCPWTQSKTCFIAGSAWAGSSTSSVPRRARPWPAATAPPDQLTVPRWHARRRPATSNARSARLPPRRLGRLRACAILLRSPKSNGGSGIHA
jgi:hypothetical protein